MNLKGGKLGIITEFYCGSLLGKYFHGWLIRAGGS
jgi:hypothetical protein